MPSPQENEIAVTMPDGLAPVTSTNILKLEIAVDKNGGRLANRTYRDANGSDTGRRQRQEWEIGGTPIGRSLLSTAGNLGIDFTQNLDTRYGRELVPVLQQTLVDLTPFDPPGLEGAVFDIAIFDASYFGSDLSGGTGGDPPVTHFAEQDGYLLVARGQLLTQVSLTTWAVISTTVLDAPVLDMDHWFGQVYVALGASEPLQRVVAVLTTGPVLEDVVATSPAGTVYASAIKRGSDRAWYVDADQSGSTYNFVGYTLDAFVTLAAPFQVGDPRSGVNGLGPFNSLLAVGEVDSIYTATDQGKSVPLSRALDSLHSTLNGAQFADPGFGWNYYLAVTGLRAHTFTGVDNPSGIGPAQRNFTGHNGLATAVYAALGELLVVFQTTDGDLYGYRGLFDPQRTGGTGQPALFPWFYAPNETCLALYSSTTPNLPVETTQEVTLIRGSGTNLRHQTVAANEMDNIAPHLAYDTAGGTAYLTTYDQNPNLLRTLRLARLRDVQITEGTSWTVGVGFDSNPNDPVGATYTTVGSVTANGETTLTPTGGTPDAEGNPTPTDDISGHTLKPRIVLSAVGAPVINLVTNPSFETGTTAWSTTAGAALSQSTAQAKFGPHALAIACTNSAVVSYAATLTAAAHLLSAYLYIPASLGHLTAVTVGFTGFAGATGTLTATADLTLRDQWQRVTVGPVTPDAGDLTGTLTVATVFAQATVGTLYLDGVMCETGSTAHAYVDGSLGTGYAWNGAANASASTFTPATVATLTPPELLGTVEFEWDERPEQLQVVTASVKLTTSSLTPNQFWTYLRQLVGVTTAGPFPTFLPDDLQPAVNGASGGGQVYTQFNKVADRLDTNATTQAVQVELLVWPMAEALSNS